MQIKPQITFQDFPVSKAVEQEIARKIRKLEQFCKKLVRCDVVARQIQRHKHQGKLYSVHITVTVPGETINASHAHNEDVYIALRDAFDTVTRQLHNYSCKRHGRIKHHETSKEGRITKLHKDAGFGFIDANGAEYYFSSLAVNNTEFERLREGMKVSFLEAHNGETPQANHINLLKHTA